MSVNGSASRKRKPEDYPHMTPKNDEPNCMHSEGKYVIINQHVTTAAFTKRFETQYTSVPNDYTPSVDVICEVCGRRWEGLWHDREAPPWAARAMGAVTLPDTHIEHDDFLLAENEALWLQHPYNHPPYNVWQRPDEPPAEPRPKQQPLFFNTSKPVSTAALSAAADKYRQNQPNYQDREEEQPF